MRRHVLKLSLECLRNNRLLQPLRRDDDRGRDTTLVIGRDEASHQLDQFARKERIEREVVDRDRLSMVHDDLAETRLLDFLDEVTLRQSAGYSTGPGCRVQHDLGRELLVPDGQIRHREPAARFHDACTLGEYPSLPS